MKEYILSPFYSVKQNQLIYLDKYKICELPNEESIKQKILKDEGVILYKKKNSNNKSNNILVLEPHPDDFALSALGYTEDNEKVTVLNVFSKMNIDSFTWNDKFSISEDYYEKIRIKEDKLAIEEILRQNYISLNEKSMRITDKSRDYIKDKVIKNIENILKNNPTIEKLLVPMGVGMHPDHIIVYESIMDEYLNKLDKRMKVILYPEYPYARCKKFYNDRLKQIQKCFKLKTIIKNVNNKINDIVNAVSVYRSQYDDINKLQMLAVIREDTRAIAEEYEKNDMSLVYFEVER